MNNELPSYAELKDLTDHEILLLLVEKLRTVIANQTNHLRHHWTITLVCVAAGLTGTFNLGIALLILFFRV